MVLDETPTASVVRYSRERVELFRAEEYGIAAFVFVGRRNDSTSNSLSVVGERVRVDIPVDRSFVTSFSRSVRDDSY